MQLAEWTSINTKKLPFRLQLKTQLWFQAATPVIDGKDPELEKPHPRSGFCDLDLALTYGKRAVFPYEIYHSSVLSLSVVFENQCVHYTQYISFFYTTG